MKYSDQPQPFDGNRHERRRAEKLARLRKRKGNSKNDFLWGAEEIGRAINRTPQQVYEMMRKGLFGDAVQKYGHRTMGGMRDRILQALLREE